MDLFGFPDKTGDYSEAQTLTVRTLNSAATVTWNLQTQQNAELTLTATTTTIANPIGWKNGRMAMLEIIQGTSTTVAWGAMFINVSGLTLNSTAGYSNVLIFKCVQVSGQPKVMLVSNSSSTRA